MPAEFLYGLIPLSFLGYAAVTFAVVQFMFLAITLYLHRDQSHGGLVLHPALRHIFRFWLWFCSGTRTRQWVAVHRLHHACTDRAGDPHSPVLFGMKRVVLENYELYVVAANDPRIVAEYGRGTPDDWLERHVYRHSMSGLCMFAFLQLLLFGIAAIPMLAVQLVAQPFAGGIINGLGHGAGYRSFEISSAATNIVPWGLLLGGEELHNNHHAFIASPRFSVQRWEFDIGWAFICLFRTLGLARVRRLAPTPHIEPGHTDFDADTARALFINRVHVLRDYARRVTRPVVRELARQQPALMHNASRLLVRHPDLLDPSAREHLRDLLDHNETLRTVVEFRERLQRLWERASNSRAPAYLRELCARAEDSGISALRDFALRLPSYTPASNGK